MHRFLIKLALVVSVVFGAAAPAFAYDVPGPESGIKYFYVFGSDGDPLMGREEKDTLELYIDVPQEEGSDVVIDVYDPDTSGKRDWTKDFSTNEWNTSTEFTVYSGTTALDSQTFGKDDHDGEFYRFGPYSKEKGEKVGRFYRFKLVAKGKSGDDQNLFKVRISPESAESFVYEMTFRLASHAGARMYFFPEIAAGTKRLTVHNYDLDIDGGSSALLEGGQQSSHPINDSLSGQWAETPIDLAVEGPGRLVYEITKKTQPNANAGLKITDESGNPIPIYFRKGTVPASPQKAAPAPAPKAPVGKCNTYTFDGRRSHDADNEKISYFWDFGDGTTSSEPVVTHTFPKAGDYDVTLKVVDTSDLDCNTDTTSTQVTVNTPPTAALSVPPMVCTGESVELDASASTDDTPSKLTYRWTLGDGTAAEGASVSKTFQKGGEYKIRVSVDDNSGTACNADAVEKTLRVNTVPSADAGKDVSLCQKAGAQNFSVRFDGAGSRDADGDKLEYAWDFGDGESGEGPSPTHVYERSGNYKATLTVNDGSGSTCSTAADSVAVDLNRAPVASAGDDVTACAGASVSFDASGTQGEGDLNYAWDFGDGEKGTGKTAQHTYARGGNYHVTLTVDDGKSTSCSMSQDALNVRVNSAPDVQIEDAQATCTGKAVQFKASASDPDGDPLRLRWDFGDGTVADGGTSMSHAYDKGGSYTVTVSADDGKGGECSLGVSSAQVKVNAPPAANAGENKVCCTDQGVEFDGSKSSDPDGDTLSYRWTFGDGGSAEGARVEHAYTKNGTYPVLLTVNDGSATSCSESSAGFTAKVNAKPVSVIEVK